MIYLDNASTTCVAPEVIDAMLPYFNDCYGNPGTLHSLGVQAKKAVERARAQVAHFIGASPEQIIFTSGGTEANNAAIFSSCYNMPLGCNHVLSSKTEHDSVLKALKGFYRNSSIDVDLLSPQSDGSISEADVLSAVNDSTWFMTFMYVNNETGAENPVKEIGEICRSIGAQFHVDCVQAASVNKINVTDLKCSSASFSSHKLHGPKGIGALYIEDPGSFVPLICGGDTQEFGLRGGTENVPGIVGFGAACELMERDLHEQDIHTSVLKQVFYTRILEGLRARQLEDIIHLNGDCLLKHGKILNVRFDNVDGETLLLLLDRKGVCVSAGSACRSHLQEPSRTLVSMGISPEDARNSVRVSFSRYNTEAEVINAAEIFVSSVAALHQWC